MTKIETSGSTYWRGHRGGVRTRSGGQCHLPCRDRARCERFSPKCRNAYAGACCAASCGAGCCQAMTHGRWGNGNTAVAFPSTRRCASRPLDRAGRERLLRYCARPPFALERLRELGSERLLYEHTKPGPGGDGPLLLTPLELLDRLAALVPSMRMPTRVLATSLDSWHAVRPSVWHERLQTSYRTRRSRPSRATVRSSSSRSPSCFARRPGGSCASNRRRADG